MGPTGTTREAGGAEATARRRRATRKGMVISDKGDKTVTVVCDRLTPHAKYGKYMRRRTTLRVHDVGNEAKVGDRVEVMTCRPTSKTKTWRLVKLLS